MTWQGSPLPWSIQPIAGHYGVYEIIGPVSRVVFFTIATDIDAEGARVRTVDARAMAAAPLLIETIEAALPMLRSLEKFGEDSVWRPAKRHREAFEAALATAEGGTHAEIPNT